VYNNLEQLRPLQVLEDARLFLVVVVVVVLRRRPWAAPCPPPLPRHARPFLEVVLHRPPLAALERLLVVLCLVVALLLRLSAAHLCLVVALLLRLSAAAHLCLVVALHCPLPIALDPAALALVLRLPSQPATDLRLCLRAMTRLRCLRAMIQPLAPAALPVLLVESVALLSAAAAASEDKRVM